MGLTVAKKIFDVLSMLRKPAAKPPLILYQLSSEANLVKNSFSPQPQPPGFRTGPMEYYKKTYPDAYQKAGILHVNSQTAGADVHVPFGGVKGSGYGPHEQGRAAIEFYS